MVKKIKEVQNIAIAARDVSSMPTVFASDCDSNYGNYNASSSGGVRRNAAANIPRTNAYSNIEQGLNPFYSNGFQADISRTVWLCQQAWYNVPVVRQTIDIMTELSDSRIYLKGGNKASRDFIGMWFSKINLEGLKEQFFREYYRSGNVFLFRFDADFTDKGIKTLSEVYGASPSALKNLPIRYVLINPARVRINNTVIYTGSQYFMLLNPISMNALKNPKSEQDQMLFNSLDPKIKKQIKDNIIPYIPLDQDKLYSIFSKKQDYEPFAVPFIFPVLEAVNAYLELQKCDMALARVLDRSLLLITNGAEPDKGGINPENLKILNSLFRNESVSRTLIADHTTKGEWLIPEIDKILGPTKYEELNRQINIGLNSIFFDSNEKFANTSIKTQIFIERLSTARKAFSQFLQNEVNRVCKLMNFKIAPQIYFEDIQLKNETDFIRLFTRMVELGILTPKQFFKALDTGELPDTETDDYLTEIKEYQEQRTDGLFLPLVGASMQDPNGVDAMGNPAIPPKPGAKKPSSGKSAGRPAGSKAPQTTKRISPIGASVSVAKLRDNTIAASVLVSSIEKLTKKKNKLKELDSDQKDFCNILAQSIMLNEDKEKWESVASEYLETFKSPTIGVVIKVEALAQEHNIGMYDATLLYLSQDS